MNLIDAEIYKGLIRFDENIIKKLSKKGKSNGI